MTNETKKLLDAAKRLGITRVSIGKHDAMLPDCQSWNCSVRVEGRVFSEPVRGPDGWPAIWDAVKASGTSWGCGSGNSCQYRGPLDLGIYVLSCGDWFRLP